MAPPFTKEGILQGAVDNLCLVCEIYLRTPLDVATHVAQPDHRKNFETTDYLEKYRSDRVRKVKRWYLCEICHVLLSTITKVGLHVEEPSHCENKSVEVTREGATVVVGEGIAIQEDVWHGLLHNTCAVCNVDFDEKDVHKSETQHVINLILNKVNRINKNIYRKVLNDSSYHCLTCNKVVANIDVHIDQTKHKELIQKCNKVASLKEEFILKENPENECLTRCVNANVISNEITNHPENAIVNECNEEYDDLTNRNEETPIDCCDLKFDKHVREELLANNYITNINNGSSCILCHWVIDPLQVNDHLKGEHHQKILKMHQKRGQKLKASEHQRNLKKNQYKKDDTSNISDSIPKYQKENININLEMGTAFCKKCSKLLKYNSKDIENHIEEHKNIMEKKIVDELKKKNSEQKIFKTNDHVDDDDVKKGNVKSVGTPKRCDLTKVPFIHFVRRFTSVENIFFNDVIVNSKYCLNLGSFSCITKISETSVRCFVCELNVKTCDLELHMTELVTKHERAINEMPVLIHSTEFIREIRSGSFHCGFCNCVEPSWEQMCNHLTTTTHKESKDCAYWRLMQHFPAIEQHELEQAVREEVFQMPMLKLLLDSL